jgi:hypothetical protein
MITREELELLISGAVTQSALGIESANGRTLTRTETDRLSAAIATAMRMVADRCAGARIPPPPPVAREQGKNRWFNPVLTQEIRQVTDEDIRKATLAGTPVIRQK